MKRFEQCRKSSRLSNHCPATKLKLSYYVEDNLLQSHVGPEWSSLLNFNYCPASRQSAQVPRRLYSICVDGSGARVRFLPYNIGHLLCNSHLFGTGLINNFKFKKKSSCYRWKRRTKTTPDQLVRVQLRLNETTPFQG